MGTWQTTQKKITEIRQFEGNYGHIIKEILPYLGSKRRRKPQTQNKERAAVDTIILILGSERGLCGRFNESLAENARGWIDKQILSSYQVWAVGKRMIYTLERMDIRLSWRRSLPSKELISYTQSYLFTQDWLEQYERNDFNHLVLLYNQPGNGMRYQFTTFELLPYEIAHPHSASEGERWPPPIIETNPKGIYHQIIHQYIASSFFQVLLKSTAAEHASRYYLLENAQQNAEEIIEELNQIIHTERKRRITQQVQELAVGAGLLDNK